MRRRVPVAVLGIVLLLTVSMFGIAPAASPAKTPTKMGEFRSHIQHIIFLLQENHAYDSLFGTYCLVKGPYCHSVGDGVPAGTCVPLNPAHPSQGCTVPFNFTAANLTPIDMTHDWNSTHRAWNNGSMNGFYIAEGKNNATFGHYNGTLAPVYWDLAEEYGLADDFFSPAASYSLPNHWYAVSGTAPNASYQIKTETAPVNQDHAYLNQSNATPALEDELLNSSVSWDFFDYALPSYHTAIQRSGIIAGDAYDYWNPLASRQQSYTTSDVSHFQNRSAIFGDLANGTLPSLSWVIPDALNSDHPPENLSAGQDWVASLVDALEKSPEWNSTVLFVSWDEYGGFYDHVAPPQLDAYGDGFRVPMLAIGPWVRQGYIDDRTMNFDSILHLMERTFHLPCLTYRDCNATLPLEMFNFQHGPRAPIQIPLYGTAVYPMPLQSSGTLPYYGPGAGPPIYWRDPGAGTLPSGVDWA